MWSVELYRIVADIASGAQQQASGLELVNGALSQMEATTQTYATMANQTSVATQRLTQASDDLAGHIAQFRLPELRAKAA